MNGMLMERVEYLSYEREIDKRGRRVFRWGFQFIWAMGHKGDFFS
jgi:hypothetical protein